MNSTIFQNAIRPIAAGTLALAMGLGLAGAAHAKDANQDFRTKVEQGIDKNLRLPTTMDSARKGIATVAVTIDGNGTVRSADIVKSSGWKDYDKEALRTARSISYPATGTTSSVAMVLGFNKEVTADMQQAAKQQFLAWRQEQEVRLAGRNEAQQPDS